MIESVTQVNDETVVIKTDKHEIEVTEHYISGKVSTDVVAAGFYGSGEES